MRLKNKIKILEMPEADECLNKYKENCNFLLHLMTSINKQRIIKNPISGAAIQESKIKIIIDNIWST